MKLSAKVLVNILVVLLVAAPVAVVVTYLLYPLWSWLDVLGGIESLDQSGPAAWCYESVYLVLVVVGVRYMLRKNWLSIKR